MVRYTARLKSIVLAAVLTAVVFGVSGCSLRLTITIPLEEQVADALDDLVAGMEREDLERVMGRYLPSYASDSLYDPNKTDYELLRGEMQYFFWEHSNIQIINGANRLIQPQSPSTVLVTEDWTVTALPDTYATAGSSEGSLRRGVVITPNPPVTKTVTMWFRMLKQDGKWFIISDSMPELLSQF